MSIAPARARLSAGAAATCILALTACAPALRERVPITAPYAGVQVWAVAPPLNESGVSLVDTALLADAIAREAQQIEGIEVLPVNRVLAAMRSLGIEQVLDPGEARAVLEALHADALIVGSVTAWDPYPPLTIGMALELYGREGAAIAPAIEPETISRTTQGEVAPGAMSAVRPLAQAAGVFDGRDHQTLIWLKEYAESRHEPDSAYGGGIYLVRMDLFTQFVGHHLLRGLLGSEQARLGAVAAKEPQR